MLNITSPPGDRNPNLPPPVDVEPWTRDDWELLRTKTAKELKALGMLPWAVDDPEERLFDIEPILTRQDDVLNAHALRIGDRRTARVPEAEYRGKALYLFPCEWLEHIPTDFLCVDIFGDRAPFNPADDDRRLGALSSGLLVDP